MNCKSTCVNLVNKLVYEVCLLTNKQREIDKAVVQNNRILNFTNTLNYEILGLEVSHEIIYESYELYDNNGRNMLSNNLKLFNSYFSEYLNTLEKYNVYIPGHISSLGNQYSITRINLTSGTDHTLRTILDNGTDIFNSLENFILYLETSGRNNKKTAEIILQFLSNFSGLEVVYHDVQQVSKISTLIKSNQNTCKRNLSYIKENESQTNNQFYSLLEYLRTEIELSRNNLLENHISDVNNPDKSTMTIRDTYEGALNRCRNKTDGDYEPNEPYEPYEPYEPSEPSEPSECFEYFDNTTEDFTSNSEIIFDRLKNILDVGSETTTQSENIL